MLKKNKYQKLCLFIELLLVNIIVRSWDRFSVDYTYLWFGTYALRLFSLNTENIRDSQELCGCVYGEMVSVYLRCLYHSSRQNRTLCPRPIYKAKTSEAPSLEVISPTPSGRLLPLNNQHLWGWKTGKENIFDNFSEESDNLVTFIVGDSFQRKQF